MKNYMKCFVAAVGLSVGVTAASGQSLNEDLKLRASDGSASDGFGISTAIDNGVLVVGADQDDFSGSVYLLDAITGEELFKLTANDRESGDQFGYSVGIHDGIVVVGARSETSVFINMGAAYLFDASTGTELFKLTASDGGGREYFGNAVAINNGVVAVGSSQDNDNGLNSGSVFLFDVTTGEELFKLTASDGAASDAFGYSIAIDDGILAIGAYKDDDRGRDAGAVYLFDVSTGNELYKLTLVDGLHTDYFGSSVAIDNGVLAVGAYREDDLGRNSGAVHLFDVSTGALLSKLTANDGEILDFFGYSVAMQDGILAVGANGDDDLGLESGSAYLFDVSTGVQLAKLTASDGGESDSFGGSIAIANRNVVVGASFDDDLGVDSGSAYVFDVSCRVDMNNDFALNFYDVSAFFGLFVAGDLAVDFNGDGDLNFGDVSAFITEFGQGCPFVN